MSIDLFRDDLTRATPQQLFDAVQYLKETRTREGYLLDYKEIWDSSMIKHVAALANTFGGVIVIGVTNDHGAIGSIIGVISAHELTTQIANTIATMTPRPQITVAEQPVPNDPAKVLVVIRIQATKRIHLILKKGEMPVYVRNLDQSIPADAHSLRALIDREYEVTHEASSQQNWSIEHELWIARPNPEAQFRLRP